MEVEIISREIIKPSKSLNNGLKSFQVSMLDILAPNSYNPIIFFYSMNNNNQQHSHNATSRLKLSLSQALVRFPMVAGKFKGDSIHCSNEEDVGALFVEAKAKISMAEFLKAPNLQLLAEFLPLSNPNGPSEKAFQITVQVNVFECGGIAIGAYFLHKVMDGTAGSAFIRSWAASCEGRAGKLVCGSFGLGSSLFPRREIWDGYGVCSEETPFVVKKGKSSTTRRFVLDAMAIANLKGKAKSASVPYPSRVEVVTSLVWKYALKASRSCTSSDKKLACGEDPKRGSAVVHFVDMRRRIEPPLSENEVGNILWRSSTYYEASSSDMELADLVILLRQSLSKINNDFIQKVTGDDGFETFLKSLQQLHEIYAKSSETFLFTSWRNMGFNEVNFGWGRPAWVACGGTFGESIERNVIVLIDTPIGEGLEVWITLDDETMNLLENDPEFLKFASLNPSVKFA
ncbi:BAHD acyltransferase At5g47980-like [Momordica charantia]|uniref:BAHD acyltransferase At5g47980-like n=1 Tax=Momordica charantia TaxID=3673 RepID=A0A6J1C9B9_MOMCH|nr:BAHD acyltransferase At5g47980-like [Momordica charantia]